MHSRQLERELAEANRIIRECLSVMPVGYIPSHTPENLPAKIECIVKELAENTTIRHERVAEELAEVTKQRDELADALQRFVNRLQYNSIYMNNKPTCARVNRNPIKEWDEDCIFAFEILERLKGGAQ